MKDSSRLRRQVLKVLARLEQSYPRAECALHHANPWQLLVATILSAQCTDQRVNLVTPVLFQKYPDPAAMAQTDPAELEEEVRSTGFFRNKARSLLGCARAIAERHGGEVPRTMEELTALPGVGRKTANVILGNAFDTPGMVVDTHVKRVAGRLGWTEATDPNKIEQDLCALLPEEKWTNTSHVLIHHGRAVCKAPTPRCSTCPVLDDCPRVGVTRSK